MRLIQVFRTICLLLLLASPASIYAAQPSDQTYGPVEPKEILSVIAQKVRGEWRIPLKYMVQALHELNPQAFSEGDIGRLQIGSTLVIPDLKALSEEVPELLANKPTPPTSKPSAVQKPLADSKPLPIQKPAAPKPSIRPAVSSHQQIKRLQILAQEQLGKIEFLLTTNRHNTGSLKNLTDQVNASKIRNRILQEKINKYGQKQKISDRRLLELEGRLQTTPASTPVKLTGQIQFPYFGPVDLYLILLAISILLSIIAIFMARRPSEPMEITISESLPEPVFHPEVASSEPYQPNENELSTDTIITQPTNVDDAVSAEPPTINNVVDDVPKEELYEKGESTDPLDNVVEEIPEEDLYEKGESTDPLDNVVEEISEEDLYDKGESTDPLDDVVEEIPEEDLYDKGESTDPLDNVVEEIPEEDLYDKGEATAPLDKQELPIPQEFMTQEEANELEKTGDVATIDIDGLDEIEQLKTEEDEIEAKLSFAYLHLDMGDPTQAEKTLSEIDLVAHPQFTDKVNEIRTLITGPADTSDHTAPQLATQDETTEPKLTAIEQSDQPQETAEFELDDLEDLDIEQIPEIPITSEPKAEAQIKASELDSSSVELSEITTAAVEPSLEVQPDSTDDAPDKTQEAAAPKLTALEKVLTQQLKLARTYNNQGKSEESKSYIAKILRNGTPDYRKQALVLLQDIEFKTLAAREQAEGDAKDNASPTTKIQSGDILLTTGLHEIIPSDISNRFNAYMDNEDGTKLTLAYLFLDLDEVDTAIQLLEEVLESDDSELIKEAEEILEQLVVF